MTRNMLNFIVDTIIAVLALSMVVTGLLLRWVLPPGSGQQRTLWGLDRHGWGDVHWWLALLLVGMVVLHLVLHWRWVCTMVARVCRRGSGAPSRRVSRVGGVAAGVVTALAMWAFVVVAERTTQSPPAAAVSHTRAAAPDLRGSTTLDEAAALLDVDLPTLRDRLSLPADVSANRRLGQIAQERNMRMSDLRALAVAE